MKIEFLSHSANEGFARVAVASFFSQLDPMVDELYDVKMAVSEAVTNSIIHGYKGREDGLISILCSYDRKEIFIEITDQGVGIEDIEKAKQPLYTSLEEDERAGLGFTIMESMMNELTITSKVGGGTKILMKKVFY
jgi:stage II sporulation protein AB (anti-sigma F factor)